MECKRCRRVLPRRIIGKQVQDLCDLVTVSTECDCRFDRKCFWEQMPEQILRKVTGETREGRQSHEEV